MKRLLVVILLGGLFGTFTTKVKAQGFHLGIKGGANITKINGQSFDQSFKLGYSLGGFAELNFTKEWGIQPELLWNQSKTTTSNDFNQIYYGIYSQDITLNYLSIPILLTYRPVPMLSLQLGPQFGYLISEPSALGSNITNAFKNGDFSILGGAQLNLGAFRAGARYFIGLNNINNIDNKDTWKNQGFQLYIGIRII
ncbi:MAG: hypothetical protein C5B59_20825 [Bacteroidetes bacterium]|nr:MAG: hypothetical protein C5B59_20825 [Bacteroidota bacterium]